MPSKYKSNVYINIESLGKLNTVFENELERLTTLFFNLESEIEEIETGHYWRGESFDAFKGEFEGWKIRYLKNLARLVQLQEYVKQLEIIGIEIIEDKNALRC